MIQAHSERKHSKFSASGSERWFNCPGSVALSEGVPDRTSVYAKEGTQAHEVLEKTLLVHKATQQRMSSVQASFPVSKSVTKEMINHALHAANFIMKIAPALSKKEVLVETRIKLDFIHPEMFGTFDAAVVDHFGTLHVFDYKYGKGHAVSPVQNLQMMFYGIGLAHLYNWNFKNARLWIIQPRVRGYDGPTFWDVPILQLKSYVNLFRAAVENVERSPNHYREGSWCHWCKAKNKCPLKDGARLETAQKVFSKITKEK